MRAVKTLILAHVVSAVAAGFVGIGFALAYILVCKNLFGFGHGGVDGVALAPSIVVFSTASTAFVLLIWSPVTTLWWRRSGLLKSSSVLLLALGLAFVASMIWAGPSGFTTRPGTALFNYFVIPMFALGAVIDWWLVRFTLERSTPFQ